MLVIIVCVLGFNWGANYYSMSYYNYNLYLEKLEIVKGEAKNSDIEEMWEWAIVKGGEKGIVTYEKYGKSRIALILILGLR